MMVLALLWLFALWVLACAALVVFNLLLTRLIETLVPPIGRFIDVDGLRLHYVDTGDKPGQNGPPLLFLHGWGGQLNHFAYSLAALFPERRVVLLDRPGCGYSQPPRAATIQVNARIIAAFIAQLGLPKPLVVGHSLGGPIALTLALDHGDSIASLALIAPYTHFTPPSAFYTALARQHAVLRWLTAWTVAPLLAIAQRARTRAVAFGPDLAPPHFWKSGGGALIYRAKALYAAAREAPGQERELTAICKRYPRLSKPVSVLFGAGDRTLEPKAQGEAFCAIAPGAHLSVIDGGHCLPMTRPKDCEIFIRAALARV